MPRNEIQNQRPLPEASAIIRLHDEIVAEAKRSLEKAIRLGELLSEVKGSMPHGSWMTWCEDSIPRISERTIRNYMRVFRNKDLLMRQEITDPAAAYKALTEPKRQPLPNSPRPAAVNTATSVSTSILVDGMGFPIPPMSPALATYQRTLEMVLLLDAVKVVHVTVHKGMELKDKMYREINFKLFFADIENAHAHLTVLVPYAVCPTCQGLVVNPCATCGGRGMVSEFYWKHKVPKPMKDARMKAIEDRKASQ